LFTEGTMEEVYRRRTFENSQLKRKRKLRSLHKKSKYL
jgi:ribosomal protein S21